MSEVIPSSPIAVEDAGTVKSKAGRQSRFSTAQYLVIVREFAAAGGHLAAFGETRGKFKEAESKVSENAAMHENVSWKTVRDRYKRIQDQFDKRDSCERRMSGIGVEIGELDKLLTDMPQGREYLLGTKTAEKTVQRVE